MTAWWFVPGTTQTLSTRRRPAAPTPIWHALHGVALRVHGSGIAATNCGHAELPSQGTPGMAGLPSAVDTTITLGLGIPKLAPWQVVDALLDGGRGRHRDPNLQHQLRTNAGVDAALGAYRHRLSHSAESGLDRKCCVGLLPMYATWLRCR